MKGSFIATVAAALALTAPTRANATFIFFFIPGSVVQKIGDTFSGTEGEECVRDTAKVGDIITSPVGNAATVKSLSGTSSKCQNPALPVRARLEFEYKFASKAGIELPDTFQATQLTGIERWEGALLKAEDNKARGVYISVAPRDAALDLETRAKNVAGKMSTLINNAVMSNIEHIKVNELEAVRLEVRGNNKNFLARSFVYVVTVLEADHEVLVLNAWSPSESDIEMLRRMATQVTGLAPPAAARVLATTPMAPAQQAAVSTASPLPSEPLTAAPALPPSAAATAATAVQFAGPSSAAEPTPQPRAPTTLTQAESIAAKLRELDKLRREGVITQRDFETKKQELLKAM